MNKLSKKEFDDFFYYKDLIKSQIISKIIKYYKNTYKTNHHRIGYWYIGSHKFYTKIKGASFHSNIIIGLSHNFLDTPLEEISKRDKHILDFAYKVTCEADQSQIKFLKRRIKETKEKINEDAKRV